MTTATKEKKPKAPKKKKLNKFVKQSLIEEKIVELLKARTEFGAATLEWEEAHAHAGELKKTMERKQALLNSIVADIDAIRSGNYTPQLPFSDQLPPEEAWKAVELSTLINGAVLKSLEKAKLKTVGQLADYSAANRRLVDIKGITEEKAEQINEALSNFWKSNPQFTQPSAN